MKTFDSICLITMAALCMASCKKEQQEDPIHDDDPVVVAAHSFKAIAPATTKITLQSDYSQTWNAGDEVSVFDGTDTNVFTADSDGESTTLTNESVDIDESLTYYAAYPVSESNVFATDGVTITIPTIQHLSANPFEFAYGVASCTGAERAFAFKNIASLVSLEITESNVNNIIISGDAGEHLTGTVKANYSDASYVFDETGEAGTSLVLASDDVFTPGYYYAAILPQTFSQGLTITLTKKDGTRTQRHIKPFTLGRSTYIDLAGLDDSREWSKNVEISNAAELQAFLLTAAECDADAVATLMNDIDLTGVTLETAESFAGTFDGNGKALCGWNTSTPLFATLSGTVENLIIDNASVYTVGKKGNAAFIAGENSGEVTGCVNNGVFKTPSGIGNFGESRAMGTIVALNTGTVTDCTNNGNIGIYSSGYYKLPQWLGGVVGKTVPEDETAVSVSGCTNNGDIRFTVDKAKSANFVGGVVGGTEANKAATLYSMAGLGKYGSIKNCTNNADITVTFGASDDSGQTRNLNLGGVVGYAEASVTGCENKNGHTLTFSGVTDETASVAIANCSIGGVAGFVLYSLNNCTNGADMSISGLFNGGGTTLAEGSGFYTAPFFGGVAGAAGPNTGEETISGCINNGALTMDLNITTTSKTKHFVGGVVAYAQAPVTNCNNNGAVDIKTIAQHKHFGGICGLSAYAINGCRNTGDLTIDNVLTTKSSNANDVRSTGNVYVGGISGIHSVPAVSYKIDNSDNSGNILFKNGGFTTSKNYVGGIAGLCTGEIHGPNASSHMVNSGNITATAPGVYYLGGVAGTASGKILYATNTGDITVGTSGSGIQAGSMIGGIAGTVENTIKVSIDGSNADDTTIGVGKGKAGYVASSTGDVTAYEAASKQSGVGLGFGKVNGTGTQTVGTVTTAPQWHTSRLSGNLTVSGDQTRVGVLSGGGVASGIVCGLTGNGQGITFGAITYNGTTIDSNNIANYLGQNLVLDTNVLFRNVVYDE